MGVLSKVLDLVLTLYLLIIAIGAPLIDSQTFLPNSIFPVPLVQLKQYYIREYGDYLMSEKPSFFVGIVWLELLFQWPLCLANLYGIWSGKSWVSTTCLMYGVSVLTAMAAILSEMTASGKASDKMKMAYFPFLGLGILAILRGFLPGTRGTTSAAKNGPASEEKADLRLLQLSDSLHPSDMKITKILASTGCCDHWKWGTEDQIKLSMLPLKSILFIKFR